jgi:hypothetical protein
MKTTLKTIELEPIGAGAFTHKLECWLCNDEPAVYSANPDWCFLPCWKCQKKYTDIWTKKTFYQKLKELL